MGLRRWLAFVVPWMAVWGPAVAAPADQLMSCMRANIPQSIRVQAFEIRAVDRGGGERVLQGRLFGLLENGELRVMVRVEAPADLAGSAYLIREQSGQDEMYLYLPAIRRAKRLTGSSVDGELWGTDLSYSDIKQLQNAFTGADVVLGQARQWSGRAVQAVQFTPREQDGSRFQRVRALVDRETCVALQVEFHENDAPRRELSVDPKHVKRSGKHWYAEQVTIRDLRDGTQTLLRVTDVKTDGNLSSNLFNPKTFHVGG